MLCRLVSRLALASVCSKMIYTLLWSTVISSVGCWLHVSSIEILDLFWLYSVLCFCFLCGVLHIRGIYLNSVLVWKWHRQFQYVLKYLQIHLLENKELDLSFSLSSCFHFVQFFKLQSQFEHLDVKFWCLMKHSDLECLMKSYWPILVSLGYNWLLIRVGFFVMFQAILQ